MPHDIETRKKRLRYRASHTGTKETDLLVGGFVDTNVDTLSRSQIEQIEALLDQAKDLDMMDWIVGRAQVPAAFDNDALALLRHYAQKRHAR